MYSADCGLQTYGLTDLQFYSWNALFFADTLHMQQLNKPGTTAEIVEEL